MKIYLVISFFFLSTGVFSQEQFSVFFDSNAFKLNKKEIQKLKMWIKVNKEVKIVGANGFCDEDGTTEFNDTLAQKRINFVFNILKNKLKIRDDFKTRNFGELHQLSKIKSENRKVTLFYIQPKDFIREDQILKIINPETISKPKPEIKYPEKLVFDNPNGTKSEFKLDVAFMKKVNQAKAGEKLKLENLNFQINTFAIIPESRGKLYELLIVLESNPNLKIEIQGHLCCMPSDKSNLSTARAKAIYSFLLNNKIEKSRLSYQGFGSTIPIFAIPEKTEAERAANRRVEILILQN